MDPQTKRAAPRVATQFRVDCSYEKNFLISYTKDISVDGMFLKTEHPAPAGSYVKLVFSIGKLHEVTVSARVVWSAAWDESINPGMGVQFLDPPETLRKAILDEVGRIAVLENMVVTH